MHAEKVELVMKLKKNCGHITMETVTSFMDSIY